jgi:hypothetical protein
MSFSPMKEGVAKMLTFLHIVSFLNVIGFDDGGCFCGFYLTDCVCFIVVNLSDCGW